MSLLRSVLRKSASPGSPDANGSFNPGKAGGAKSSKSSAQSFKSVASTIKSISSFYSALTGNGPKIPKRRRPPILTFGAPTFYHSNPPPAELVIGVERVPLNETSDLPFTAAHATSLMEDNSRTQAGQDGKDGDASDSEPWLSIVLFSHASSARDNSGSVVDTQPVYHDQAEITGEVRMVLNKPKNIESIDVWVSAR